MGNKRKPQRKMTRVHTRKLDRLVAKHNAGSVLHDLIKSWTFRKRWREYAGLKKKGA